MLCFWISGCESTGIKIETWPCNERLFGPEHRTYYADRFQTTKKRNWPVQQFKGRQLRVLFPRSTMANQNLCRRNTEFWQWCMCLHQKDVCGVGRKAEDKRTMTYRGRTNPPGHSSRLLKWRNEAMLDTTTADQKSRNYAISCFICTFTQLSGRKSQNRRWVYNSSASTDPGLLTLSFDDQVLLAPRFGAKISTHDCRSNVQGWFCRQCISGCFFLFVPKEEKKMAWWHRRETICSDATFVRRFEWKLLRPGLLYWKRWWFLVLCMSGTVAIFLAVRSWAIQLQNVPVNAFQTFKCEQARPCAFRFHVWHFRLLPLVTKILDAWNANHHVLDSAGLFSFPLQWIVASWFFWLSWLTRHLFRKVSLKCKRPHWDDIPFRGCCSPADCDRMQKKLQTTLDAWHQNRLFSVVATFYTSLPDPIVP